MQQEAGRIAPRIGWVRLLAVSIALVSICWLAACGGGTAKTANIAPSTPVPAGAIPLTFFAVNDTTSTDPPRLNYGTLGHPVPLAWQTIEQSQGVYNFQLFDNFAQIAPKDSSGNALMVMTLGKTPPWATSDPSTCVLSQAGDNVGCTAPPSNIQYWTNFITALMQHYNGVNAPHIKYYELWNEADPDSSYWTGTAAQLAQLAVAAYPIIKQDPNSYVLTPSMAGNVHSVGPNGTIPFLTAYLQAGGGQNADIGSFHGFVASLDVVPYPLPTQDCPGSESTCGGSITAIVNAYRQTFDANGLSGKPMFNTEGGFEGADIPDPDTAAAWLAQYYALQAGMYNSAQLQLVSWFTWGAAAGQLENNDVLTEVGTAYNQLSNWLVGRTLSSPCSPTGTIWTCTMTGSNGYQAEIIWDSSQTCASGVCSSANQPVNSTYTSYEDLAGNSGTITGGAAPVGLKPILLEN
jgi:hypothetical protein